MPDRLPSLRPQQVLRALQRAAFSEQRQTGSHVILHKEGHPKPISVPRHNRELKRGTLLGIIADAGLTVEEFLLVLRG